MNARCRDAKLGFDHQHIINVVNCEWAPFCPHVGDPSVATDVCGGLTHRYRSGACRRHRVKQCPDRHGANRDDCRPHQEYASGSARFGAVVGGPVASSFLDIVFSSLSPCAMHMSETSISIPASSSLQRQQTRFDCEFGSSGRSVTAFVTRS
jgi:hypothetical protein